MGRHLTLLGVLAAPTDFVIFLPLFARRAPASVPINSFLETNTMTFKLGAVAAAIVMLASNALAHEGHDHSAPVAAPANPAVNALRLYKFNCGTVRVTDISVFSPGFNTGVTKTLTASCYLIAHPKGTLMWDTGLSDEIAAMKDGMQASKNFHMSVTKPLAEQFKEIGFTPSEVNYLGISHMHFDHIGNTSQFPKSTLLMQKAEYEAGFGPDAAKFGNNPANYPTMAANPVEKLNGDHDVFGDGSVVIKSAPGHSPGHQMLFLKLKKSGNILLSGDMVHFTDNWKHRRVPGFNFDKEVSVKTMEDAVKFLKANKATLWIQHDLEQNAKLKHAPKYYE
jgi:N-acyl homoserine lactone hydrolase